MVEKKTEKKLYEEIQILEGIEVNLDGNILKMKKDDKEITRKMHSFMKLKIDDNKLILSADRNRKVERKLFGTYKAHIKNMIKGLEEGFKYRLQISNVHFPMNVSHDKANNKLVVKNFLGEKTDRIIPLIEGVGIKIDNEIIEVDSYDIEKAGQVATSIEKGSKVKNKDRRVYQDGIFIIEKPGRTYL
jgi:large subunit ribosomal protein L6